MLSKPPLEGGFIEEQSARALGLGNREAAGDLGRMGALGGVFAQPGAGFGKISPTQAGAQLSSAF